ncbi:coil containing protein [Vibrio phage 217E38-1]|nr:coil containing protein [Vibrio phage 217E38-1]
MGKVDINKLINDRISSGENLKYIRDEFREKLWGSTSGDVTLAKMLEFAIEYDWLLDMIIDEAKKLKD